MERRPIIPRERLRGEDLAGSRHALPSWFVVLRRTFPTKRLRRTRVTRSAGRPRWGGSQITALEPPLLATVQVGAACHGWLTGPGSDAPLALRQLPVGLAGHEPACASR
jgi:hypothetical protein